MILQKSCGGVPDHLNPHRTPKPCAIAHENSQKCPESRVFTMSLESCTGCHGALKSSRDPKFVDYSSRKRPEMTEITTFLYFEKSWDGVPKHLNPRRTPKPCVIAHENVQKCPKSRVFTMPLESCTGGHGALKSSRGPKTMDYGPRKWPETPEIASFL